MAWVTYDKALLKLLNGGGIDLDTNTFKLALLTAAYTPDQAVDEFFDEVSANEVSGTNYTAGGATLASLTLTAGTHEYTWDAANVSFTQDAAGFTDARIGVLYKDTGTPATSPLLAYYDLGTDRGNVAGTLSLQTPAGLLVFQIAA